MNVRCCHLQWYFQQKLAAQMLAALLTHKPPTCQILKMPLPPTLLVPSKLVFQDEKEKKNRGKKKGGKKKKKRREMEEKKKTCCCVLCVVFVCFCFGLCSLSLKQSHTFLSYSLTFSLSLQRSGQSFNLLTDSLSLQFGQNLDDLTPS